MSRSTMHRGVVWLLLAAGSAAYAAEPTASSQVPAEATVATVDGVAITADDVRRALVQRGAGAMRPEHAHEAKEAAVEALIRTEALARAARQDHLDQQAEVRAEIQQLLAERYRQRIAAGLVVEPVGDDQIEAFYEEHRDRWVEPLRVRGRILTLRQGAEAARLGRAEALLAQIADDADFERLARQHSEDLATRQSGGDLGWVSEGASVFRVPPAAIDALFALDEVGQLAPVIEGERGVHLVMLTGRQGGKTLPLEVVAGDIRRELEQQRRDEALEDEIAAVKGRFEIEIDHSLLERIGPNDLADATRPPSFPVGDPKP